MTVIKNAQVVLEHSILSDGVLVIDKDRIVAVEKNADHSLPENAEVIDAKGCYVGPGFVDIHVHGGNGAMFDTDPLRAAQHFLSHGETTILPTLYYNLSKEEFLASIKRVQAAMKTDGIGKALAGFYMEGPYMNPKYGASPEKNKWKGEIKAEDYTELVETAGTDAKVWAVAPEREGIEPFLQKALEVNPDVVISVGHSEATPTQMDRFKQYNLRLQTHCMNATGRPTPSSGGVRTCGPDEACLMDPNMYAEIICDSQGIHVSRDMLRFVLAIKGVDKVILISDSFVSDEPTPPQYAHIRDLQFDANGGLCGSKLTMDQAFKNIIAHLGCSINDAFLMASRNPAQVIGMDQEIGTIEVGKKANLVFLDQEFAIKNVMLEGNLQ